MWYVKYRTYFSLFHRLLGCFTSAGMLRALRGTLNQKLWTKNKKSSKFWVLSSKFCAKHGLRGLHGGVSPFGNSRITGCYTPPRDLSQLRYVLLRHLVSRHPPYALISILCKEDTTGLSFVLGKCEILERNLFFIINLQSMQLFVTFNTNKKPLLWAATWVWKKSPQLKTARDFWLVLIRKDNYSRTQTIVKG